MNQGEKFVNPGDKLILGQVTKDNTTLAEASGLFKNTTYLRAHSVP